MAGSGVAAATTWASARPSPSSSSMPWRPGRMLGQPWISITTRPGERYSIWALISSLWLWNERWVCRIRPNKHTLRLDLKWVAEFFFFCTERANLSGPLQLIVECKALFELFFPAQENTECATQVSLSRCNKWGATRSLIIRVFDVPEGPIYPCWMHLMTIPQTQESLNCWCELNWRSRGARHCTAFCIIPLSPKISVLVLFLQ